MEPFKWTYNGVEHWNLNPLKTVPLETDENFGKPIWEVLGMTEEEAIQVDLDFKWHHVRQQRDWLLAETDWVSGDDVPQELKDKWYSYRQALRDITSQTDPTNIEWPIKP